MDDSLRQLLSHRAIDTQPACSASDIDVLIKRLRLPIPSAVRSFWERSNGASLHEHEAQLLSTSQVLELLNTAVFGELLLESGFLPLLYDQESNYICAACKGPLAPRVIYVLHDDSPKVLYRNVDSFYTGCLGLLSSRDFSALFFHETPGEFGSSDPRTTADHKAARLLMESGGDWDIPIAIQLLDDSCVDEWNALLNGDRFARQDSLLQLKQIDSDASRAVLRRDSERFEAFVTQVCNAAENEGVALIKNKKDSSCVRVSRSWVDLNAFFGRRDIDNAIPRLMDWLVDIRDGHDPTGRPGHYMAD